MANSGRKMDTVIALVIFCVFSMSILLTIALSAGIYRNVNSISIERDQEHTSLAYIWSKVRSGDVADSINIVDFHGVAALRFYEEYGDRSFATTIYLHDGWLRELFREEGLSADLNDGTPVIESELFYLNLVWHEGRKLIKVTADTGDMFIFPRAQTGNPLSVQGVSSFE
ncbi:MAG: DUF4860 domain-containing protein [Oscillospiraceae bacterium]|jgi:hypothetical protein|nr:DUF4860 domain-containing protein [Oscillospiraceae bacterium]